MIRRTRVREATIGAAVATLASAWILGGAPEQAAANGCGVPFTGTTYLVGTAAELALMPSCDLTWDVRQTADIDLSASGAFTPIGGSGGGFTGTWDGGGHRITGLTVSGNGVNYQGLFGAIGTGGVVRNLTLSGAVTIVDGDRVGLLTGNLSGPGATISNVHVSGTVSGRDYVGGIAGSLVYEATIQDSSAVVDVTSTGQYHTGGIVGLLQGSWVRRSKASGSVTATHPSSGRVGGIAGNTAIYGAIVGTIENSYSTGAVSGTAGNPAPGGGNGGVGGLVGTNSQGASVTNSYSTGRIARASGSGTAYGGVLGADSGGLVPSGVGPRGGSAFAATLTGSAWDSTTVGSLGALSGLGTSRTSSQMRDIATFSALGWNIMRGGEAAGSTPWGICPTANDGRPYLQWENPGLSCPVTAQGSGAAASIPASSDPAVATALAVPAFKRATAASQRGRTRLVTRVQLGAAGTYTFIMRRPGATPRLTQYAGSAMGRTVLTRPATAPTFRTSSAGRRIVLRTYLSPAQVPLASAAVEIRIIHRSPAGALTSTRLTAAR